MKKLLLIICVLLSVNIITDDAIAGNNPSQVTGILNNIGQGGGAPECDWSAIKDSLFETESSGSGGYTAVGPETRYGYPLGKYQFIADTQNNITSQFPNCNGDACRNNNPFCGGSRASCASQPLLQEACHGVQDCLMDGLLQTNLQAIQNDSSCQQLLANGGQEISGCGQGRCLTCRATESGLLAAFHLGGPDECANILRNGSGDSDNTGTSTAYYVCRHGGLAVPGNCTPADYGFTGSVDPYSGSPVLTAQQLEIREAQGDPITFGFGGLRYGWVASFQLMTNQLHTTMIQQMQVIGSFLDAKHQLETQRLFQEMTADAHKKYHPSEQMCKIGTFTRNLGESERRAHLTQRAMASSIIDREMKTGDPSTITIGSDDRTRMLSYLQSFCDPSDNSGQMEVICQDSAASVNAAGLRAAASAARFQANQAAQTASTNPSTANNTAADTADALATQAEEEATAAENAIADLRNADINFTETISMPLTFDLNLLDGETTADETSLFAFLDQIFMHRSMPWISEAKTKLASFIDPYLEMRSLMAMRSVAQNSFSYIISEKTAGTDNPDDSIAPFLRSMMVEMGINIDEINQMIGENPSYYAQMEFLTRKIYYHPEFVSNLYDKPANVKRIAAALTAIKSMQNWQISQALKRREMLFSILLEIQLRDKQNDMETLDIPLARGTFSGSRSDSNVIYTAGGTNSGTPNSGSGNGDGDADGNGSGDGAGDGDAADAAGNASPNSDLTLGEQLQQYGYGQEIARIMTDPNRTPISIGDAAIDAGMDVIYGEYHSEGGDAFYLTITCVPNELFNVIKGIATFTMIFSVNNIHPSINR
ncbi:MAG: hypothetical protein AAGB32_03815, partial [Pseudomonadota bacterium]